MNPFITVMPPTTGRRGTDQDRQAAAAINTLESWPNSLAPERAYPQPKMAINIASTEDNGGKSIKIEDCLADSGCTHTLVRRDFIDEANIKIDTSYEKNMKTANEGKLVCVGLAEVLMEYQDVCIKTVDYVSEHLSHKALISYTCLRR